MTSPLLQPGQAQKITSSLTARFARSLRGESFEVSGRLQEHTAVARVVLSKPDRSFVYEMHAAFDTDSERLMTTAEALEVCFDFLGWYLSEYFESGRELLLPLDYKPHRFGDLTVMARGEDRNAALDDLADAWLRGDATE